MRPDVEWVVQDSYEACPDCGLPQGYRITTPVNVNTSQGLANAPKVISRMACQRGHQRP